MHDLLHRSKFVFCALFCLIGFSAGLNARPAEGCLHGKVTDVSGAAVPGLTVAAITEYGRVRIGITDNQGRYIIKGLPPGKYTIWAGGEGYSFYENTRLAVAAGRTRDLNIRLRRSSEKSRGVVLLAA